MDVSLQMTITIDTQVHDLLSMRPSEILPLIQTFGEAGGMIGEAIENTLQVPEVDRDDKWREMFHVMDEQLSLVAAACQMCNLAHNRAKFYNPDPDKEPGENQGETDE